MPNLLCFNNNNHLDCNETRKDEKKKLTLPTNTSIYLFPFIQKFEEECHM